MWKLSNLIFLLSICFPNFLYAAVAHVQSTGVTSVGAVASVSKAFAGNVTAASTLAVGSVCDTAGSLSTANVTDTQANAWVDARVGDVGVAGVHYVITAAAGATTITLTPDVSDWCLIGISEFTGGKQTAPLDAVNYSPNTSSTGTVSTTQPGLIYAAIGAHAAAAITEGADLVVVYEDEAWTSAAGSVVYRITTVAGSYDGNWTISAPTEAVVMALLEAAAAATQRPISPMVFQ